MVLITGMTRGTHVIADIHYDCKKNYNKNCNQPEKNQKSSPNLNCYIQIENGDRLNNNNFCPAYQQCLNNSNNIRNSIATTQISNNSRGEANGTPAISIAPSSGPKLDRVEVIGSGFSPLSIVTLTFDKVTVASVTTNSVGSFTAHFFVPLSSPIGDHTVKATQAFNSTSKTFTVTSLDAPIIALGPNSGPVDTPVKIVGSGFDSCSTLNMTFNGTAVTTIPSTVTTTANGGFSANFTVPLSSIGPVSVVATEGAKSDSDTFTVTLKSSSTLTSSGTPSATDQDSITSLVPTSPF